MSGETVLCNKGAYCDNGIVSADPSIELEVVLESESLLEVVLVGGETVLCNKGAYCDNGIVSADPSIELEMVLESESLVEVELVDGIDEVSDGE